MMEISASTPLLPTFFGAGFECSDHYCLRDERVDSIAATQHDRFIEADYKRLAEVGFGFARDGIRWYRYEPSPGCFRTEDLRRGIAAARDAGVVVIWDLFHYGWPNGLDFWSDAFIHRATEYAQSVAEVLSEEGEHQALLTPINEVNYFAWAGGDQALMNPYARERGGEVKRRLVRTATAMAVRVREVLPEVRFAHTEPVLHWVAERPEDLAVVDQFRRGMFEAWDMLAGRVEPELGGRDDLVNLIGVNFYANNQMVLNGPEIPPDDPRYRPLSELLEEVWKRYGKAIFVSETAEGGDLRAPWLARIAQECRIAIERGVPVEGVMLYPILDYPHWDTQETLEMGLWGTPDEAGRRSAHTPLLRELQRQQEIMRAFVA